MKHILIVEDDTSISKMIQTLLMQNHYQCTCAFSGSEALLQLKHDNFDLILLDIMLPGVDGEAVLEAFRQEKSTPIIMLTAIGDKQVISSLLRKGANDYLVKPFDNEELLARIEVQLRQSYQVQETLTHKDLILNLNNFTVQCGGKEISLAKREFEILELLLRYPSQVFTKASLYESVWKEPYALDENTINVHISHLRKKLSQGNPDEEYIDTVWGIGIKLHN